MKSMPSEPLFVPKILELLSGYRWGSFFRDLKAGLVVAAYALPLCLAFGFATGLGPGAGLLTSVVAGFVAALFGGSRVQITGPTAAFVVVCAGIVSTQGIVGLVIATFLAGLMLIVFGVFQLGPVLRLLPQPILVGFTAGIAVTLVLAQAPVVLLDPWTIVLALVVVAGALAGDRWFPRIPWALVLLVLGTLAVALSGVTLPTLGSVFGPLTLSIQPLDFSNITYKMVVQLLPSAFTLAFLGAVESLLSASVADGLVGDRHSSGTELIGQGLANALSGVFGGLPATGAMGRTTVNVRSGGRSPVAALVHSAALLAVWAGLGFLAAWVPVALLAGLVISVAFHMVDFRELRLILKTTQADALALITTFAVTIAIDLAFAVIAGLLVAFFFFVRGMAETSHTLSSDRSLAAELPSGVHVLDLNGAFFFGAAGKFEEAIRPLFNRARAVILRMDDVSLLDASGTRVLHRLVADARAAKVRVVICEVQPPVLQVMEHAELIQSLGTANLFASFEAALRNVRNTQPLVYGIRVEEGCFDPL